MLLIRVHRWVDARGNWHETEVRGDVAELLEASEPRLKERLVSDPRALDRFASRSSAWEGPRFRFNHFLGESAQWCGPDSLWEKQERDGQKEIVCRFCRGKALPENCYCLSCDRCGRELQIPSCDRGSQPQHGSVRRDGLRGGKGRS
jgi:hypothetical protein